MTSRHNMPVGEVKWVAYLDEARRNSSDLEQHVATLELFKAATVAEPGSLKIWLAYCEYFHALYVDALTPNTAWSREEVLTGREIFTLDATLQQWQEGYEAVRYRLGDSHILWDRWIELEMEQLVRTRTSEGIRRISHLYRDRLRTPHLTWDETSQTFSSFLSENNHDEWEQSMQEVTKLAQDAKRIMAARERFEFTLQRAERDKNEDKQRATMSEYLEWEEKQSGRNNDKPEIAHHICRGLYERALTGIFSTDESAWFGYISYLSSIHAPPWPAQSLLGILQIAVEHCPSSGQLWARYILSAEEVKLPFAEMERIKHAATSTEALYKNGMTSLLDMYVAWCGFLKRSAMGADATDEAADVASMGLTAAVDEVAHLGRRLYGKDYKGDPEFRLERIYTHYLSTKKDKESEEEARARWSGLANNPLYADRYDFWRAFYLWEMSIFLANSNPKTSPVPSPKGGTGPVLPVRATAVMSRAVNRKTLDWPERAIDVYVQHCNDYESPAALRGAMDGVHRIRKQVAQRREREAAAAAAEYAYHTAAQPEQGAQERTPTQDTEVAYPADSKRKRDASPSTSEPSNKRAKNADDAGPGNGLEVGQQQQESDAANRDREHTTIVATGLPAGVTNTAVRKYFKEYGHIQELLVQKDDDDTSLAFIEFRSPHEAQDAIMFRDNKYFNHSPIRVKSGARLTLFVTNYPPTADEKFIRDLFKDCGRVLAVRFPSLKFNTRRRFCYVLFKDTEASAKAVKLNGKRLADKCHLQVAYSDPSRKQKRDDAVSGRRELFVRNLGGGTAEEELRNIFSKYGKVTSCRVNGSRNPGKGMGTAFVDFETKEQAEKAMAELDSTKLGSHIMRVELAQERAKISGKLTMADSEAPSPGTSTKDVEGDTHMGDEGGHSRHTEGRGNWQQRRMAIMGLPDTVNDARVMALAATIGKVNQVTVKPLMGTAIVEFVEESDVGRALLKLDGYEMDGATLKAGTVRDLHSYTTRLADQAAEQEQQKYKPKGRKSKDATAPSTTKPMLAPLNVRRPVLGKARPKQGLGFVPKKTGDGDKTDGVAKNANGRAAPKSNADFKAMFIKSGQQGGGNGKDDSTS